MRDLKIGISTLREKCRNKVGKLPPEAAEAMREWFRLRNYLLDDSVKQTHQGPWCRALGLFARRK